VIDGDSLGPVEFDGVSLPQIELTLSLMEMGRDENGEPSWLARMIALRDRFGPFRLTWLESLLRAADARASAKEDAGE
jgi:CRISPR-associated endonuclease/helicase Cas3